MDTQHTINDGTPPSVLDLSDPDALLTEDEEAAWVRLSVRTLRKWRRQGKGPPFIKLGCLVRYQVRSTRKWLEEQQRTSTRG